MNAMESMRSSVEAVERAMEGSLTEEERHEYHGAISLGISWGFCNPRPD